MFGVEQKYPNRHILKQLGKNSLKSYCDKTRLVITVWRLNLNSECVIYCEIQFLYQICMLETQ